MWICIMYSQGGYLDQSNVLKDTLGDGTPTEESGFQSTDAPHQPTGKLSGLNLKILSLFGYRCFFALILNIY